MTLKIRLFFNLLLTAFAIGVFASLYSSLDISLNNTSEFSGWVLFASTFFLFLYQLKKRFTFLPLGKSSTWLQSHLYGGLFSSYVFFEHIHWQVPQGLFEISLGITFFMTALTGIFGISLSRRLSYKLSQLDDEIIFETIPERLTVLREQEESVIVNATEEASSNTLAQFHVNQLSDFFDGPKYFWRHLTNTGKTTPLDALKEQERYMNETELKHAKELRKIILQKEKVDAHHALQLTLKNWLLIHVPLAYTTILLLLPHITIVYAFGGA